MQTEQLVYYLDKPGEAVSWLRSMGLNETRRAHENLLAIASSGITLDLLAEILDKLAVLLPALSDADMALNNLQRFIATARSPLLLGSIFTSDDDSLTTLLQILSTSQYLSNLLVTDPESFDLLRITEGEPVGRETLVEEIAAEAALLEDESAVVQILRRYKHREMMRIAYGDIVRGQSLETVTKQISILADAICEAAVRFSRRRLEEKWGVARCDDGRPARFVVLALGKLGGMELNYSSDIDLVFLYEAEGKTDGSRSIDNGEFFDRLGKAIIKLLTETVTGGLIYRVDMRLRPQGRQGPIAVPLESAWRYYDLSGRTWERQAYVKARPVAGDLDLGRQFLQRLEPWIYRRYLSLADITGINALKQRIERHVQDEGGERTNVKTGRGGIRDIEFAVQFLQLLHGADLPELRTGNTLHAIRNLARCDCLTMEELGYLEKNYVFLRKVEHRLQIMFDLQTHTLPTDPEERRKLAVRMGYVDRPPGRALTRFEADFDSATEVNRTILNHLLRHAFPKESDTGAEADLVLDPEPSEERIRRVLVPHGFRNIDDAYRNLMQLSTEKIPFLGSRRCRHFLVTIVGNLLAQIAETPDPDATLVDLVKVSDSLGGKGILWELFSSSPASLNLYVRLCASSPYLTGILTSNPGMIDELMDSLILDKLPTRDWLRASLEELCRGAEDTAPILHSFKNGQHLRVGVRDILGKEDIRLTHRALSDVAEVCLVQVAAQQYRELAAKYGYPTFVDDRGHSRPCEPIVLALGKLGGREPNYHSDLDVVFLYEGEGNTRQRSSSREETTNQHFFGQLGTRIIKVINQMGPTGRLYEIDARLRPTGQSGSLAVSLEGLAKYFDEGAAQLWERQALCKARAVVGSVEATARTEELIRRLITETSRQQDLVGQIRSMRYRMQDQAGANNLKRGVGGTVDIEFIVQMLQLRFAAEQPEVLATGTLDALETLRQCGRLASDDADYLGESYRFLRNVESRLRLLNTVARHDLPEDPVELKKLAYLLEQPNPASLVERTHDYMRENRRRFERIFQ